MQNQGISHGQARQPMSMYAPAEVGLMAETSLGSQQLNVSICEFKQAQANSAAWRVWPTSMHRILNQGIPHGQARQPPKESEQDDESQTTTCCMASQN